jgi:transcriptional regulator with PAS, ATPase and Fis domain
MFGERIGVHRRFSRAACEALLAYTWPGNVRELMNLCERLVVMSDAEIIDIADLPSDLVRRAGRGATARTTWPEEITLAQALESTERAMLVQARERHRSQTEMAKALGVDQSTVARKMKKYGMI